MVGDPTRQRLHEAVDRLPDDGVARATQLLERLGARTATDNAETSQRSDVPLDPFVLDHIPHLRIEMGMVFGWPWRRRDVYVWPKRPRP